MHKLWFILLTEYFITVLCGSANERNVEINNLIDKETRMMLGSDIELSDNEIKANDIIMDLKFNELDHAFKHPDNFNLSKHFFDYSEIIKDTELFQVLKRMPKGAVLHAHDTGILSPDYVLNLTYNEHLYICTDHCLDKAYFEFSKNTPVSSCETEWKLLRDLRDTENQEKFDSQLRKHFTIVIENPNEVYTDINIVWQHFQQYFISTGGIFCYKPIWEKYFYDTLKALREDNVMYAEIRSVLPPLYDLDGNTYDSIQVAKSYKKVLDQFKLDYPDFYGAKIIYAPLRRVDDKTLTNYIEIARTLKKEYPDLFAGFDLVGQEDLGRPLNNFIPHLSEAADDLDYFFHAGETNWYGLSSDDNLYDAIVLGTKRIGHAFSIIKHPVLMEEIKKRGIALEVNVISNAVLKLVDDVRNHPLATFLANDLPVVISSDDPGLWEADPLTHDFYVTFIGVASRRADLRLLKKLALNSLKFSAYTPKDKILHEFEIRWTMFIDSLVHGHDLDTNFKKLP